MEALRTLDHFYPWMTSQPEAGGQFRNNSLDRRVWFQPSPFPAAERQWRAVDVVLDCFLVEDSRHRGGFASKEDMVKALLVLRQVPVPDDGSLEGFTDFQLDTQTKDNPPVTFEASGNSLPPPRGPALLGSLRWDSPVPRTPAHISFPGSQASSAAVPLFLPSGPGPGSPR